MPQLNLSMTQAGPIVDVWVAISEPRRTALKKAGQTVPPPVKVRGLVDTGASCTAVDPSVIQKLQVPATGTVSVLTPSTGTAAHVCNQYDVLMAIIDAQGNPLYFGNSIPVLESSLAAQGIEALIGRDVLSSAILIYNGAAAVFTLAY
jgi:hypothetical protein